MIVICMNADRSRVPGRQRSESVPELAAGARSGDQGTSAGAGAAVRDRQPRRSQTGGRRRLGSTLGVRTRLSHLLWQERSRSCAPATRRGQGNATEGHQGSQAVLGELYEGDAAWLEE